MQFISNEINLSNIIWKESTENAEFRSSFALILKSLVILNNTKLMIKKSLGFISLNFLSFLKIFDLTISNMDCPDRIFKGCVLDAGFSSTVWISDMNIQSVYCYNPLFNIYDCNFTIQNSFFRNLTTNELFASYFERTTVRLVIVRFVNCFSGVYASSSNLSVYNYTNYHDRLNERLNKDHGLNIMSSFIEIFYSYFESKTGGVNF